LFLTLGIFTTEGIKNNNNKVTCKQRSLKKLKRAADIIQCCGTGVSSGVVQKLPSTVTKDAGRLVGCCRKFNGPLLSYKNEIWPAQVRQCIYRWVSFPSLTQRDLYYLCGRRWWTYDYISRFSRRQ